MSKNGKDQPPEDLLWESAIKLRTNMDAASYKHPVLGLIFLKYISDSFTQYREQLEAKYGDPSSDDYIEDSEARQEVLDDRDEYRAVNVFWVPEKARWASVEAAASTDKIAKTIDDALAAIEAENSNLRGTLPRIFQGLPLRANVLGELVELIGGLGFDKDPGTSRDLLGRVYEYFIKKFAKEEGQGAGAFYTPQSVTSLLVEMLEPYSGRVFDPACGSCGLFIQSARFIEEHQGSPTNISIFGQESTVTTERIGRMNLAIHGLSGDIKGGDSLLDDQFPTLRADYVLANPPFNQEKWGADKVANDPRWKFGTPPEANANYAWIQHFIHHLGPNGRAGFVLANGSLTSNKNGENHIRRAIIEADLVDCIVALPPKLFYSTGIPVCLWFIDTAKTGREEVRDRKGETLFIDARNLGTLITRTQLDFSSEEAAKITSAYHSWRGEKDAGQYADEPGFCGVANLSDIAAADYTLSPGRYVGAPEEEEDEIAFEERMAELVEKLAVEMKENERLTGEVKKSLEALGYGV